VSAALTSEIRAGVQARLRSVTQAPGMSVPPPIWAGVIQVFFGFLTLGALLVSLVGGGASVLGGGLAGSFGRGAEVERVAVWFLASAFFSLAELSVQFPVAVGLFGLRRWAYGVYLWSIGPIILISIILLLTRPALSAGGEQAKMPLGFSMVVTVGFLALLALLIAQIVLVLRSKEHLVN
jgi:hypothetical protein